MDFILLDWTRMGRIYCIAGVVVQAGAYRVVRPLPTRHRDSDGDAPNHGWSPFLLEGHSRWEVFELVQPSVAATHAPHNEDVWVHSLRPRRRFASPQERRAILGATLTPPGKPTFGTPLTHGYSGIYAEPGSGERSLASVVVPSAEVQFTALWRDGAEQPDYHVSLPLPEVGRRILPVKDHFLLCRAEKHSTDIDVQLRFLLEAVRAMGAHLVVRLGLSRALPAANGQPGRCWLMADGFFNQEDPQP